jgi:hypothetical protein
MNLVNGNANSAASKTVYILPVLNAELYFMECVRI